MSLFRTVASGMMLVLLVGSMFFSMVVLVRCDTDVHDLDAVLQDTLIGHFHLPSGQSDNITATVVNYGNITENNVSVQLLINGTVYLQAMTPRLVPNASFSVLYPNWTPDDGIWNVTVYAPPLGTELNTTNNVDQKLVNVCPNAPPVASFSYSPQPPITTENVTFDATGSIDSDWGNITNYSWNFGGVPKSSSTPLMPYKFPTVTWGNVTVSLTVYDTEDENTSASTSIWVVTRPVANFTIAEPKYFANKPLTFNATPSYDLDNYTASNKGIAKYAWDFGDGYGNITTGPITQHTYAGQQVYNVTLNVTDSDDGLISSNYLMHLNVSSNYPTARFTVFPQQRYVNHPLTFNATASIDLDSGNASYPGISTYTWDFGDGSPPNVTLNPTINYTYTNTSNYTVSLTVMDSDEGLTNSTSMTISVTDEVLVQAVDGVTLNATIVHDPGENFNVNVTVTNVQNLYSFYFKLSWVTPWIPPEYLDLFDPNTMGVHDGGFLGPRQFPNGTPGRMNFSWDSSHLDEGYLTANGTLSVDAPCSGNGTLAYVTFKVLTSGNCTLQLSDVVLSRSLKSTNPIDNSAVNGLFLTTIPVANFTFPSYPAAHEPTSFDASASYDPDNSTTNGNGIAQYSWDFGDGNHNTTKSPMTSNIYASPGTHNVTLTVTDYEGNSWNLTRIVTVFGSIHDVGVTYVGPPPYMYNTTLGVFETSGHLPINVTIWDNGTYPGEIFNVVVYAQNATGAFEVGNQTVQLQLNSSQLPYTYTFTFQWDLFAFKWGNSSGLSMGDYNLSAVVTGLPSDPSPDDNSVQGGIVRVYLTGDVSSNVTGVQDNATNFFDIAYLIAHFNAKPGNSLWVIDGDLNGDGVVNMKDIAIAIAHFNIKAP